MLKEFQFDVPDFESKHSVNHESSIGGLLYCSLVDRMKSQQGANAHKFESRQTLGNAKDLVAGHVLWRFPFVLMFLHIWRILC